MNLIVDTNIVFSALLNPHSAIGEVLMNIQDEFIFFAPELLKDELKRYSPKIAAYTKLEPEKLLEIESFILSRISFIPEESISEQSWFRAFELTKNIDEDDTPFVALSIELDTKLWTGDKVLTNGLAIKGVELTITTADMKKMIGDLNN